MDNPFVHPDRNLALELVRATEAAAIRAAPFVGRGDKNAADGAAARTNPERSDSMSAYERESLVVDRAANRIAETADDWKLRGFVKSELFTDEQAEAMYHLFRHEDSTWEAMALNLQTIHATITKWLASVEQD